MPGSDASQFTQFKRANAVYQKGDSLATDPKSVNRLTQFTPFLSGARNTNEFLATLTAKSTAPNTRDPINFQSAFGKRSTVHQNCS
jgi:hypothetical protein